MKKYQRYQDYVIKDGKFVGEFEQMYKDFDDPWEQSALEQHASEKAICVNLIEAQSCKRVIEFGCGFGQLTDRIRKATNQVVGVDVSPTAIKKASQLYPKCVFKVGSFPDFDLLREFKPDCIVMAEITWYILDDLDDFICFLKANLVNRQNLDYTRPSGCTQVV